MFMAKGRLKPGVVIQGCGCVCVLCGSAPPTKAPRRAPMHSDWIRMRQSVLFITCRATPRRMWDENTCRGTPGEGLA